MREIILQIDGREVKANEGITVLEAARGVGIFIPTLCHEGNLEPYGGCRICTVEVEARGRTSLVAACLYPVAPRLVVRTRTEQVARIRRMLLQLLLAHAPEAPALRDLARQYGADAARFEKEPSFCILCGLCVRYCAEIKKAHAIAFVERGARREISFIPEIAARECWSCKACFPLCPTEALQAAYLLTEALAFPPSSAEPMSPT